MIFQTLVTDKCRTGSSTTTLFFFCFSIRRKKYFKGSHHHTFTQTSGKRDSGVRGEAIKMGKVLQPGSMEIIPIPSPSLAVTTHTYSETTYFQISFWISDNLKFVCHSVLFMPINYSWRNHHLEWFHTKANCTYTQM